MPFTFSHPAVVLPLNYLPKKWFSITALIVGSLMPDLEAFLRFKSEKDQSHSWDALFWFCLPLGLAISFLFHLIVRNPFIFNLPPFFQKRFINYAGFDWLAYFKKNVAVVLLSLLIGGASHLIWDSFSHYEGVLLKLNPEWNRNTTILGYSIEIVYVIQYLNSILGLAIIAFAVLQLPAQNKRSVSQNKLLYWLYVAGIASLIFIVRWLLMDTYKIDDVIISALTAAIIGVGITSLLYHKKYRRRETAKK